MKEFKITFNFAILILQTWLISTLNAQAVEPSLFPYQDLSSNQWGYIDTLGNWIIAPQFESAEYFSNGLAIVNQRTIIDKNGRIIAETKYDRIRSFKENHAIVQKGKYYGFIDRNGRSILEPKEPYLEMNDFCNGITHARIPGPGILTTNRRHIFIDSTGNEMFNGFSFDQASDFSSGWAAIGFERDRAYIDPDDLKFIVDSDADAPHSTMWNWINKEGYCFNTIKYRETKKFVGNIAVYDSGYENSWIIDNTGKTYNVMVTQFANEIGWSISNSNWVYILNQNLFCFRKGIYIYAAANLNIDMGILDTPSYYVIARIPDGQPFKDYYKSITKIDEPYYEKGNPLRALLYNKGIAIVTSTKSNAKYYNLSGEFKAFSEALVGFKSFKGNKWGFISIHDPQHYSIEPQFDSIVNDFNNGLARIKVGSNEYHLGYVNKHGKLIPKEFEEYTQKKWKKAAYR